MIEMNDMVQAAATLGLRLQVSVYDRDGVKFTLFVTVRGEELEIISDADGRTVAAWLQGHSARQARDGLKRQEGDG